MRFLPHHRHRWPKAGFSHQRHFPHSRVAEEREHLNRLLAYIHPLHEPPSAEPEEKPAAPFARWHPRADWSETENEFHLEIDLPGVTREDIEVKVEGDWLHINGSRQAAFDDDHRVRMSERGHGRFHRIFLVPRAVSVDDIRASFERGVLHLRLPKRKQHPSRAIAVS